MLWVALVFQFLSVSLFRVRRKKAFCLIHGFFAQYWCCEYTAALQKATYLGMAYSLKLCAVQVQGHGQWVPDGSLPSCLFAAKTLPALEEEGWKGSWVPTAECLGFAHHTELSLFFFLLKQWAAFPKSESLCFFKSSIKLVTLLLLQSKKKCTDTADSFLILGMENVSVYAFVS